MRTLYEQHGGALLGYAMRITGDRAAAEDVLQETLLRAWRHAGKLSESSGSIRGWLFTVARNVMTDAARARSVRPQEVAESPVTVPTQRDHADTVVDSVVALDALRKLPGEQRDVLVEIYFGGRSVAETAEKLGIPPGTVKSRTHHAMKNLRRLLSRPAILEEVAG
ncbi:sigma-70 family RNA polymerase sigma factor [Plantactinospora sp. GCM10030261]|uniref:sigma-70 family RNA polymerase sigma factor n=1 Tax=Plantactinospora sp. GCM10030261 TaxID=3273420 RepID=UPI0036218D7B